jgi:hypothetical protein
MEARVGDCVEMMQIAIPYYTLEPLVLKLNTMLDTSDKSASVPVTVPIRWNSLLDDVAIPMNIARAGYRVGHDRVLDHMLKCFFPGSFAEADINRNLATENSLDSTCHISQDTPGADGNASYNA